MLGLDRLAKEKRAAAAAENGDSSRKKARLDDSEPKFKGRSPCTPLHDILLMLPLVPSLPASRTNNLRQRGEETPSHPGGLSETGRKRLEEFKRKRESQRGELYAGIWEMLIK